MRAATVVQVLRDFEAPPTIAPRPPTTVANPHIDRSLGSKETRIQSHNPGRRAGFSVLVMRLIRRSSAHCFAASRPAGTKPPTGAWWRASVEDGAGVNERNYDGLGRGAGLSWSCKFNACLQRPVRYRRQCKVQAQRTCSLRGRQSTPFN